MEPYSQRLERLHLEPLITRRFKQDVIFLYKILNDLVHVDFQDIFQPLNRPLRNSEHKLQAIPASKMVRQHHFVVRVIKLWNSLPVEVASAHKLSLFRSRLSRITFQDHIPINFFD